MATKPNKVQLYEIDEQQNGDGQGQEDVMLPVKEVAALLGIHPNTVRIWTDSGVLRAYRIGPRRDRRIPLAAIKFMLNRK